MHPWVIAPILLTTAFGCLRANDARLRVDSDLVLVPVTVTDRNGAPVSNLTPAHFRITDENEPRDVVSLERDESPMSVVFVLDTSGSMRTKLAVLRPAVRAISDLISEDDEAALITFSERPQLQFGYTQDARRELAAFLAGIDVNGSTALNDAIWEALQLSLSGQRPRRAVVVITDGGDNHSRHTAGDLIKAARESGAQIYGIAIHQTMFDLTERSGSDLIRRLAADTGGTAFQIRKPDDLLESATQLANSMRNLYVVGFYAPEAAGAPRWRRIRVKVDAPGSPFNVCSRSRYLQSPSH